MRLCKTGSKRRARPACATGGRDLNAHRNADWTGTQGNHTRASVGCVGRTLFWRAWSVFVSARDRSGVFARQECRVYQSNSSPFLIRVGWAFAFFFPPFLSFLSLSLNMECRQVRSLGMHAPGTAGQPSHPVCVVVSDDGLDDHPPSARGRATTSSSSSYSWRVCSFSFLFFAKL